ncbi:unnamed protein product [Arabidopsis lyrata]|nr:unnamed protein product [Arabidopsis lyrata]
MSDTKIPAVAVAAAIVVVTAVAEASMVEQAKSRPISLTDDYTPRVMPLILQTVKDHDQVCYRQKLAPLPLVRELASLGVGLTKP